MSESDIPLVSKIIESEKDALQTLSQEIWKNPELCYKEIHAHRILTDALRKYGFTVQEHYLLPTAFRGEVCFGKDWLKGPTIVIICEYDALPTIGHACGHNLIAECGIASSLAVKTLLQEQSSVQGKLVVLGTPAEEGGGGKIKLLNKGAFKDVDVALMAHPTPKNEAFPTLLSVTKIAVTYIGEERNVFLDLREGKNSLDAAALCYSNVVQLKQQIKPTWRINGIMVKSEVSPEIVPRETQLEFWIRAPSSGELNIIKERIIPCFNSAAVATGCEVRTEIRKLEHKNVITNKVLADLFIKYAEHFGLKFRKLPQKLFGPAASTDMGNVSHAIPSIHPFFGIGGNCVNHTRAFTSQAATAEAQTATLAASKAIALVAIKLFKFPELLERVKSTFNDDILADLNAL